MKQYIAIDLKSFYASVECVDRGLDPMDACLLVADPSRTDKTICLAVSPALKAFGIPGRPRLFEVKERLRAVNRQRAQLAPGGTLAGYSHFGSELKNDPRLGVEPVIAPPRMAHYMDASRSVYRIYLKYLAPEDIHVYSIDEVFLDVTPYLATYGLTAREFAVKLLAEVLTKTGITATAGIGTNLYLAKIAMDIVAKKAKADKNGARLAELDEISYRELLWAHRPLTDFWRIGAGTARKLERMGLWTMGDVARFSLTGEDALYRLFGVNAELLIDHAWGYEPCTIADIRAYRPDSNSISSGQVLSGPYDFQKARLVTREMADALVLDLVERHLVTDQIVLTVGYDVENLSDPARAARFSGEVTEDHYGRKLPKSAHGTIRLPRRTASSQKILQAVGNLFDRIVDKNLLVRRMYVVAANVVPEDRASAGEAGEQLDLFSDPGEVATRVAQEEKALAKEKRMQETLVHIKKKFGKNAILKGMNLEEGATARDRNGQVGGHKA